MNDHEFWNELGNLYFMSGAYQPAIHAYARSIMANRTFGRPYSNMALAFTQTGQYTEAIELYHRGIELLDNEQEKAATWNRLGLVYRQLKDYHSAVAAYQKADELDPTQDKKREDSTRMPLTLSMPPIDLYEILHNEDEEKLIEDVNTELEDAEDHLTLQWFDGDFVPPDPEVDSALENVIAPEGEPALERGEWKPAQFEDVTPVDSVLSAVDDVSTSLPIDEIGNNEELVSDIEAIFNDSSAELEPTHASMVEVMDEPLWRIPRNRIQKEEETPAPEMMHITEPQAVQYSQVEYPLTGNSSFDTLDDHIEKFKDATVKNPRSAIAWEELGDVYKKAGRYKDAIRAYERAINISAKPSYYYRLGLVLAAERKESEAIDAFQKTLELDNHYALAHASLGSHYRKIGLDDLAQKHIDIALNTAFEDENEYNRACLEAICGNTDRALDLLEVALKTKQTHISWAMKDPDLDSLRQEPRFNDLLSVYATG